MDEPISKDYDHDHQGHNQYNMYNHSHHDHHELCDEDNKCPTGMNRACTKTTHPNGCADLTDNQCGGTTNNDYNKNNSTNNNNKNDEKKHSLKEANVSCDKQQTVENQTITHLGLVPRTAAPP